MRLMAKPDPPVRVQRNVRLRQIADEALVAEARRRGISIAATLELAIERLTLRKFDPQPETRDVTPRLKASR